MKFQFSEKLYSIAASIIALLIIPLVIERLKENQNLQQGKRAGQAVLRHIAQ